MLLAYPRSKAEANRACELGKANRSEAELDEINVLPQFRFAR